MSSDWTYPAPGSTYDLYGCVWTAQDAVTNSLTTIVPLDFTVQSPFVPYRVTGTITADYSGWAMLGFDIAEPAAGANCAHNAGSAAPGITLPSGTTGIVVSFSKTGTFTFRVQLNGPNAATDSTDYWCSVITGTSGTVFLPFSSFYNNCWSTTSPGNPYVDQLVASVSFVVPGNTSAQPFDFMINGFAMGTSAFDAPTGVSGQ